MLLNELPDDCLLTIFDNINLIGDLINFSKVCSRWKFLIDYRLAKVKCLLSKFTTDNTPTIIYIDDPLTLLEPKLNELLPNLKILDIGSAIEVIDHEDISDIVLANPSIDRLIYPLSCKDGRSTGYCFEKIDHNYKDIGLKDIHHPDNLIQIYFRDCRLSNLSEYASKYSNLVRLHINDIEYLICFNDIFYKGPMLLNLKVLELTSASYDGTFMYPGYHLMDFCPSLHSAFFYSETINYYVNESVKNLNLRDLVIEYMEGDYSQDWPSLRSLLSKFSNLRHLAVRGNDDITDDHIEELVQMLPEIRLLDFRQSPNVSSKSVKYLNRYCCQSGRSITIYYNTDTVEPSEWPKLDQKRDQICYGFNFMKHCFFRSYYALPLIMDT